MTAPVRVQRKRTKGWRMPPNTVYVGRPGKWGNPFVGYGWQASFRAVLLLGERGDRGGIQRAAVKLYRLWLTGRWRRVTVDRRNAFEREITTVRAPARPTRREIVRELRGKNLACWCGLCPRHKDGKPFDVECQDCEPCHSDPLGQLANRPAGTCALCAGTGIVHDGDDDDCDKPCECGIES